MLNYNGADITRDIIGYEDPFHFKQIEKGNGWISDELKLEMDTWDCALPGLKQPVLINAPTGRGKSTFVLKELARKAKNQGKCVILLTNRFALNLQQKMILTRKNGEQIYGSGALSDVIKIDNIFVLTYQELFSLYGNYRKIDHLYLNYGANKQIGFLVFDEVHFFLADAAFNADTQKIYDELLAKFYTTKRIYLSATPEDVKALISYKETALYKIYSNSCDYHQISAMLANYKTIVEYKFSTDYSHVHLSFFRKWEDIILKCNSDNEKWLIFVSKKETGRELKSRIKNAEFIDSSAKDTSIGEFNDLVINEMFEYKVLISTAVLDNGINFDDSQLKHIVIDSVDRTQILQMLGRKRRSNDEIVNLYVMHKDRGDIDRYYSSAVKKAKLLEEFKRDPRSCINSHLGEFEKNEQNLFSMDSARRIYINEFAVLYLDQQMGFYQTLKRKFVREGEFAFSKQVCSWFNIPFHEEMYLEDLKKKLCKKLDDSLQKYIGESPLEEDSLSKLNDELVKMIAPFKEDIDIRPDRKKTNINNIIKYFSLPYECKKANKQHSIIRTDVTMDGEQAVENTEL